MQEAKVGSKYVYILVICREKNKITNLAKLAFTKLYKSTYLGRDMAQWLERGALPMSLPAVRFRIPLGAGFSEKYHVSPLSTWDIVKIVFWGKTLHPQMLHLTQVKMSTW